MFNVGDIVNYAPELKHNIVYEGKILKKTSKGYYLVRWYKNEGSPTYQGIDLEHPETQLSLKEPLDFSKEAEWE